MFIFSNLAISLDGKIATANRIHFPLGTDYDRKQMQVLRRKCDAVLMGASTLRAFKRPCLVKNTKKQPVNVILSSKLKGISPDWPFFKDTHLKRILFVDSRISSKKLRDFKENSKIIRLKPETPKNTTARQIIRVLEQFKIRCLLIEGGGGVMWDFVSQNLIDEYHVTLTPWLIGGGKSPTLVDGLGFFPDEVIGLKLKKCRRIGDELYLTYCRARSA